MIHILDLPGQGDPAHDAPGEMTYPDTCDLIEHGNQPWKQCSPKERAEISGIGWGGNVCIYIYVCI